eukprot:scaffold3456_cov58-Phaeocystis_antarctica.AAC.1
MYTIATVVCDASPVFTRAGQVQSPKVQRMRSKAYNASKHPGRCVQCLPYRRRQDGAPVAHHGEDDSFAGVPLGDGAGVRLPGVALRRAARHA